MAWLRGHLMGSTLGNVRLATLVCAILTTVTIGQVGADASHGSRLLVGGLVLLLLADFIVTFVRKRVPWWEALLIGPLLYLYGLQGPSVAGAVLGVVLTQSLYGSTRSTVVRTIACVLATAVPMLTPEAGIAVPTPQAILLGPALFAALMRFMFVMLLRQEQVSAREALLARVGRQLLGVTQLAGVQAVVHEAGDELCAKTPGLGLLIVAGDRDGAVIRAAHGLPEGLAGRSFPLEYLTGFEASDVETAHRLDRTTGTLEFVEGLAGHRRGGWHVLGLGGGPAQGWLLAGATQRLPASLFDVLRTLTTQLSLAEANCASHAELSRLAHNDQLTTTPNRGTLFNLLAAAVDDAAGREDTVALCIIDLDDFKQINDRLGHGAGDQVLVEVANRMTEIVAGAGVASRFGGDEFALLMTGLSGPAEADGIANRLRQRLLEPIRLPGADVTVGASIGVVNAVPGVTAGDLMRCADVAMDSAKSRGKCRVERFEEDRHGDIAHVRQLEDHLGHAIHRGEIAVHYQPLIDLKTGRCHSLEALARWHHPSLGPLPPETFIALAERQGSIVELGAHVLLTACTQLMEWDTTATVPKVGLTVNVSARQLTVPGFDEVVRAALATSGLAAERLTLEFIESEALGDDLLHTQLRMIAAMGVRIALDDFGGGLTSLAYLQAMPLHQLKIDRRLFIDSDDAPAGASIQLIMAVSHFLRLETVAEAVETPEHADWARQAGITLAQGFLFSPALPAHQVIPWLSKTVTA